MAKKEVTDALEAAKITAPAPKPAAAAEPSPAAAPVEPSLPPPPKAAPAGAEEYRVVNKVQVSWGGQFIRLNPGDIVSERLYGVGAVEKLRTAGVALEPVG